MNYASLLLAVIFGVPAVIMLIRHKAPRTTGILFALTALGLLAGVPSLLAQLGHPVGRGPVLLIVVGGTIGFLLFFWFDVIRGEHKTALFKGKGGGAAGQGGGGKNHHVRPIVACVGLTVFGLMTAMNWTAIVSGTSNSPGQVFSIIRHHQAG